MDCNQPFVPQYFHQNNRRKLNEESFYFFHKLFQIKWGNNPIVFPGGQTNALSCKWSKFIKLEDILKINKPPRGDNFDYCFVKELKNYKLVETHEAGSDYDGTHVLKCVITHDPKPCDYSHVEVLIDHEIYSSFLDEVPYFKQIYTYEDWNNGAILNRKSPKFFKQLRKNYRRDLIDIISRLRDELGIFSQIRGFLETF